MSPWPQAQTLPRGTGRYRLRAADVVARLRIDRYELGHALGLPVKTAVFILKHNAWPRGKPTLGIERALRDFLKAHGATHDELTSLFERSETAEQFLGDPPTQISVQALQHPTGEKMLPPRQSLSADARRTLKLFVDPFNGPVERDEQFFRGRSIEEVREACMHCAASSGFMAVVGESGAGKTTIKEDVALRLARLPRPTVVIEPSVLGMEGTERSGRMIRAHDILHAIIKTLDAGATVPATMQARTEMAHRMLVGSAQTGSRHLLVIDEAHAMPDATLKHLKRLHELRAGRQALLGVLLLGQPELKRRLGEGLRNGVLREVAQRCELIELPPLGREMAAYLAHRAAACGRELESLIEPDAVAALQERLTVKTTAGLLNLTFPLAVGNAMAAALNLAADIGLPKVSADVVRAL